MGEANPETVVVKTSKFGNGIFTTVDIPKNSILFKITGTPLNFNDTLMLGADECYSLQINIDKYIIPDYPFHLSNHSCNPNTAINNNMEFFAIKNIKAGEELCWDYSTSMLERHWKMKCECGNPNCRHLINDFDLLPIKLQEQYLNLGIVMPFIIESLYGLPKIENSPLKAYS